MSHVSFHKCKRHGVDCHVGNPVSFLPCFGALMMNLTTSSLLKAPAEFPKTSKSEKSLLPVSINFTQPQVEALVSRSCQNAVFSSKTGPTLPLFWFHSAMGVSMLLPQMWVLLSLQEMNRHTHTMLNSDLPFPSVTKALSTIFVPSSFSGNDFPSKNPLYSLYAEICMDLPIFWRLPWWLR